MNTSKILINAKEISLDFPTYTADRSLKRSIIQSATGGVIARDSKSHIAVKALDSLTFDIQPGDRVGLYGHNGSGKTTLLRALTGAYAPTNGLLEVRGKVASLLDISMGMEGDATGWENILLRGMMMGLSHQKINSRIDEIAEFSGLGSYLDMPLRTYSSGMQVRLAFSVSTIIESDILLLDEWLSVGDDDFQIKATKRLHELIEESAIMVIASHSKELLLNVCNRIFEMNHGKIISDNRF